MKITSILIGGSVVVATGTRYVVPEEFASRSPEWPVGWLCAQLEGHNLNDGIVGSRWPQYFISEAAEVMTPEVYGNELVEICLLFDKYLLAKRNEADFEDQTQAFRDILVVTQGIRLMKERAPCLRGVCSPISVYNAEENHPGLVERAAGLCSASPSYEEVHLICEQIASIADTPTPP